MCETSLRDYLGTEIISEDVNSNASWYVRVVSKDL